MPTINPAFRFEIRILFTVFKSSWMGWFDEIIYSCREAGFEPSVRHEVPQINSVINLVPADMGIVIVPESITAQINVPNVHYARITGPSILARLALVTKRTNDSKAVENFYKLQRKKLPTPILEGKF
ncbi:MAG: LysR substrate-binding domain-containing protein [Limisphaerales bacterium]